MGVLSPSDANILATQKEGSNCRARYATIKRAKSLSIPASRYNGSFTNSQSRFGRAIVEFSTGSRGALYITKPSTQHENRKLQYPTNAKNMIITI